tara:strand:- start:1053 stop:1784 length:732 start_codon:yes stop_codon:yes gene_type:complete
MSNIMMGIDCYSKKGTAREYNRDFIGLFEFDTGVLAYLLDVSSSSSLDCIGFVELFNNLLSERIEPEIVADYDLFLKALEQIIIDMQHSFKSGVASLIVSFIAYKSDNVWGYTVGDSRIGIMKDEIVWVSPVHTGANPLGESFTDEMKLQPERHILTRSLNMRKKYNPEFFQFKVTEDQSLVIASDGFWAELAPELQLNLLAKQQVQSEDDSSVITIKDFIYATKLNYSVSSENCSYVNLSNK